MLVEKDIASEDRCQHTHRCQNSVAGAHCIGMELIQNCALKSIFPGNSLGLRTLMERREVLCMKYFTEIQRSAHKLNCDNACAKEY